MRCLQIGLRRSHLSISFNTSFSTARGSRALSEVTNRKREKEAYLFGAEEDRKSFQDLGLGEELVQSLYQIGKVRPTLIQASTFSLIAEGNDVIIGAETGSGKTLSYLVPLFHRIINGSLLRRSPKYPSTFILVPSKELCSQTHAMAESVLSSLRQTVPNCPTIETATLVDGNWPYRGKSIVSPDILICTPAFLRSFLRGPHILDKNLFNSLRTLVLDEADMLLEGSFGKDISSVLDALKVTRRGLIGEGELKVHERYVQFILSAATIPTHGKLSVANFIKSHFPKAISVQNSHFHRHHPRIHQAFVELPDDMEKNEDGSFPVDSPVRVSAVIKALKDRPENIDLSQEKITIDPFVMETSTPIDNQIDSTMIFVRTAENAQLLAAALRQNGVQCEEFHKLVHHTVKMEGFKKFADGKASVLVCTDAAARGLDLPLVRHIIQAEFALNVVQHLHRIGRASRAGAVGRATNLVDVNSRDLVQSILSREKDDESVDQSFSRRRGFRRNLKRQAANSSTEESSDVEVNIVPDSIV